MLSIACMAQQYTDEYKKEVEEAWKKLELYTNTLRDVKILYEPSLEVRVCIDEAYGLVIIIDDEFFEKWRGTKAKYYADIRIELPDTAIDLTYNEFVKRITNQEGK